jgi:uncharacterized protein (TIGR01777 family)
MPRFRKQSQIPGSANDVFAWHERPGAFERLTPPWESVRLIRQEGSGVSDGVKVVLDAALLGPIRARWVSQHQQYEPGRQFVDVQTQGPFEYFIHTHRVEPLTIRRCQYVDDIDYGLPFGMLGETFGGGLVRGKLARMFQWRHRVLRDDFAQIARLKGFRPLRIAVTGSSGFIGRALVPMLTTAGHHVYRLVRQPAREDERLSPCLPWNPETGAFPVERLPEGLDALIHLAGEPLRSARWDDGYRFRLARSRVQATEALIHSLAQQLPPEKRPKVIVGLNSLSVFGDRGSDLLTEASPLAMAERRSWYAETCQASEQALLSASRYDIRAVSIRAGSVLQVNGGLLRSLLPWFQWGLGGPPGDGQHWISWIAMDDLLGVIHEALFDERMVGSVLAVAPEPVTWEVFSFALAELLRRPAQRCLPETILRSNAGDLARELLLASHRAQPERLQTLGYTFRFAGLTDALVHHLGLLE